MPEAVFDNGALRDMLKGVEIEPDRQEPWFRHHRVMFALACVLLVLVAVATFRAVLEPRGQRMLVRVTVYWQEGGGTDKWSAEGVSATGEPLMDRKSAAVDPKVIPYGSTIVIPSVGLRLKAVDTGGAVVARKAALARGRDVPVVDVFFEKREEALKWADRQRPFMEARVIPPAAK